MSVPRVLGITGPAGAGKDFVLGRLQQLRPGRFKALSVADPLKLALATLLDVDVEQLEEWKRSETVGVQLVHEHRGGLSLPMSIRTLMQRLGADVGRALWGEDFWADRWLDLYLDLQRRDAIRRVGPCTYVNASVRFDNEAQYIHDLGGEVWQVLGPQDAGAAGHVSEAGISADLVTRTIDNTDRSDTAVHRLDATLLGIMEEWEA